MSLSRFLVLPGNLYGIGNLFLGIIFPDFPLILPPLFLISVAAYVVKGPYLFSLFFLEFIPVDDLMAENFDISGFFVFSYLIKKAFFDKSRNKGPVHPVEIDPLFGEDIDR